MNTVTVTTGGRRLSLSPEALRGHILDIRSGMRKRAEIRRQMVALDRLDNRLRADVGLPPRETGAGRIRDLRFATF